MKKRLFKSVILILVGAMIGGIGVYFYNSQNLIFMGENKITEQVNKENKENKEANQLVDDKNKQNTNNISKEKYEEILPGMWNEGEYEGGGNYMELFNFGSDASFTFQYSQFNGEDRNVDFSGKWEIIHGNLLELTIMKKTVIEGGEYSKDVASVTTEYVLRGGTLKEVEVSPYEKIIYPLGEFKINREYLFPLTLEIGGIQYNQLGSNGDELED